MERGRQRLNVWKVVEKALLEVPEKKRSKFHSEYLAEIKERIRFQKERLYLKNKQRRRRYYLHKMVKQTLSTQVISKNKTVCINWDIEIDNKYLMELRDRYNYSIQTQIY